MAARVVSTLPQFVEARVNRARTAMTSALILGAAEASALTPIATSTLLNSQFRRVDVDGERVIGTVGYTAAYALPVHDPDVKQTFRRAGAEKEFLRKGFEHAEPSIAAVLKRSLKA
jgi:hypothetical protein